MRTVWLASEPALDDAVHHVITGLHELEARLREGVAGSRSGPQAVASSPISVRTTSAASASVETMNA
jgi:hypothetical protein